MAQRNRRRDSRHPWALLNAKLREMLSVSSLFMVMCLSAGVCSIHGIFEDDYGMLFARDAGNGRLKRSRYSSLIGAFQFAFYLACRHVASEFCSRLGARPTIIAGAMLSGGGLLAASYSTKIWQLCLSQGALVGVGSALSSQAAMSALTARHRCSQTSAKAAICLAGSGVGGAALSLGIRQLVVAYTVGAALRWMALVVASGQSAAILLLAIPSQQRSERDASVAGNIDAALLNEDGIRVKQAPEITITRYAAPDGHPQTGQLGVDQQPGMAARLEETLEWLVVNRKLVLRAAAALSFNMVAMVPLIYVPGSGMCPRTGSANCVVHPAEDTAKHLVLAAQPIRLVSVAACGRQLGDVYGLCLGLVAVLESGDRSRGLLGDSASATAATWTGALGLLVSTMVGISVAGWLLARVGSGVCYVPLITFAAAGSLVAAIAVVLSSTVD
ncbi:hypothetical protein GQ54DRAFT_341307 [Martensiomyces pterosporus]|nr:hypothetical protein GQ54DRAFT_341307 [Martensiomyces pterosporus]